MIHPERDRDQALLDPHPIAMRIARGARGTGVRGAHEQSDRLLQRGNCRVRAGELSSAVTLLRQAASTAEDDPRLRAWKNLGIALRRSGEDDQALEAFRCALSLDSADTEALYSVGNTYMAMGHHTDAIRAFQHVRQLDPTFAKAANNEGAAGWH